MSADVAVAASKGILRHGVGYRLLITKWWIFIPLLSKQRQDSLGNSLVLALGWRKLTLRCVISDSDRAR